MIEERKAQYGSAFQQEQQVAIGGKHREQHIGAKAMADAAIIAMRANDDVVRGLVEAGNRVAKYTQQLQYWGENNSPLQEDLKTLASALAAAQAAGVAASPETSRATGQEEG